MNESKENQPISIVALESPPRNKPSIYPEPFASRMEGRVKRQFGDIFGLKNFGVNLTRLSPNSCSALRHAHSKQDEFIYILEGKATLITDEGESILLPGMCAGFKAGTRNGHHLLNRSDTDVLYLEIGDRSPDDTAYYPDDDIQAALVNGVWQFSHKNGEPY